ncbi:unnamed protein product [Closterium sp. NIES-64]|nr:unnamed protein product [Closterium sp. NIES-64]
MAPSPFRLPKSRDRAAGGSCWLQPRSGLRSVCLLAACAAALVPLLVSFSALNATNQGTLEPPIAMCLVGSARAFEATGPSLLRHLLLPSAQPSSHPSHRSSHLSHPPHHPLHLFLHAPLDETTAKLGLFGGIKGGGFGAGFGAEGLGVEGVTIASVKIFPSSDLDETDNRKRALNWESSPQGLQVSRRMRDVVTQKSPGGQEDERRGDSKVTRDCYNWWGFNDRFGMGGRQASAVALRRLSALDKMVAVGFSSTQSLLNSEMAFKAQMDIGRVRGERQNLSQLKDGIKAQVNVKGVRVQRHNHSFCILVSSAIPDPSSPQLPTPPPSQLNSKMAIKAQMDEGRDTQMDMGGVRAERQNLSFCILTRRMYPLEDDSCPVKILSATAKVPLNGAKCRLCTPCKAGEEAEQALAAIPDTAPNWPGPFTQGIDMCSIHQPWEDMWQQQYDAVMGAELARQRQAVVRMAADVALCVRSFEQLRALSSVWSAPSPLVLCVRGQLGETKLLGTNPRQFATFTHLLSSTSSGHVIDGDGDDLPGMINGGDGEALNGPGGDFAAPHGNIPNSMRNQSIELTILPLQQSEVTLTFQSTQKAHISTANPFRASPVSLFRSEGEGRREGEGSQKAAETPSPFENSEWDEQKPAETSGTWEAELRSLFPTISILHRPPSWLQQSQQADSTERERGGQEDQGREGVQRGEVAREEEYKREAEDGLLWRVDVVKVDVADLDPALIAAWATAMHDALSSGNTPPLPSSPSPSPSPPSQPAQSPQPLPSPAPRPLSVCQLLVSFPVGEAATAGRRQIDEQLQRAGFHLASCVGSVPDWDRQCCSYFHVRNCVH